MNSFLPSALKTIPFHFIEYWVIDFVFENNKKLFIFKLPATGYDKKQGPAG